MNRPSRHPIPRDIAERILGIVATELQPTFVAALAGHTSMHYDLGITEDETMAVATLLPAAASGRYPGELDAIAVDVLAQHRAQASAAQTYRDTVAPLGPRAQQLSATGPAEAGADPQHSQTAAAVSLDVATSGTSKLSDSCEQPCAVSDVQLHIAEVGRLGDLSNNDAVLAAGVLASVYLLGDWAGMFRAVDVAVAQLDEALYVEDPLTQDLLSCWTELHQRITAGERAGLAGKILGISDPLVPADVQIDRRMQELLNRMLDAINANCDPGDYRDGPSPADRGALLWTTQAVRARLTTSVSAYSILRIKQLQVQLKQARRILSGLAHCQPGRGLPRDRWAQAGLATSDSEWVAVIALLGRRLPDGTDIHVAAATAQAWGDVFRWLTCWWDCGELNDEICQAAALLRPVLVR